MNTRREFLKTSLHVGIIICCGLNISACSNIKYIYLSGDAPKFTIKKSEFAQHSFVILKHPKLSAPVYLVKRTESDYTALLMLCTHKGCEVRPAGNFLICPCHGSEFSNTGKVLRSPATENLREFKTISDNEFVHIEIK